MKHSEHTQVFYSDSCCMITAHHRKRISELADLDSWFPSLLLVWVVSYIFHDCFQTQPGLLSSGDYLGSWKEESIATRVSQLEGK